MKINEVEALVGITKKNIRFYEEQGLISPRRNSENGYREYGPREVDQLRQVKLLRKLGVPLEEIRKMQSGTHTPWATACAVIWSPWSGTGPIWKQQPVFARSFRIPVTGWTDWTRRLCWSGWSRWSKEGPHL